MKIKMELDNEQSLLFEDVISVDCTNKFFIVGKEGITFYIKVDTIINAQVEHDTI